VSARWYARYVDGIVTGVETDAYAADMAAMSWVGGDMDGGLAWTETDPAERDRRRSFELRPITDEQAENWRAHRALDYEGDHSCEV
jgi:hypothetical protein